MNIINREFLPSTEEIVSWVKQIVEKGIRRPGYPADYWVEDWLKSQFEYFALDNVRLESVPIKKWESKGAELRVWLENAPFKRYKIPCFPIPYTKSIENLETEVCLDSNSGNEGDKLILTYLGMFELQVRLLKYYSGKNQYYDPEDEFNELKQIVPINNKLLKVLNSVQKNKKKGLIGILSDFPWDTDKFYAPYDAIIRDIPAVYVSKKNGKTITKLLNKGKVKANLSSYSKIKVETSHNVIGTLEGNSDDWIIIGTHHDGPWNSAVEDASGIGLVLAQAKYWSKIPKKRRPFNLLFLMNCAHMAGAEGAQSFIRENREILKKTVCAIHLEHVARDVKVIDDKLIPLSDPTVRWWFVSRIIPLEKILLDAIKNEDLKRSILLPPDGFPPGSNKPPTDGCFYHLENVPFISFITAPPYLFDPIDNMEMIHKESFEPLTRAVVQIINSLNKFTAKELRNLILTKREHKRVRRRMEKSS
jgi:hypothetical protein